jgi:hypothetical protein
MFLITGCVDMEADDRDLVEAFFEEWLEVKDIDPVNDDGSIDPEGAARAGRRIVTDSTGDDEADAALDAYDVVSDINEADKLMEEGRLYRDPAKMDQAIALRPDDWTYRSSRAALALDAGDMDTYQTHATAHFRLTDGGKVDPLWEANDTIKNFEKVEQRAFVSGWKSAEQCIALYHELAYGYQERLRYTKSDEDRAKLDRAFKNSDLCRQRDDY